MNQRQMVAYAWNTGMIPQAVGEHVADFGAITMSEVDKPDAVTYLELEIHIRVLERYFLKPVSASFLRNTASGKDHFSLPVDLYSKDEDLIKNGWRQFDTLEELNSAAEIEKQPEGVRNVIIRPGYTLEFGEEAS